MKKEQIIEMLMSLGLSEYEAKVYITLVLSGPCNVSSISKESGVPQSKIYEMLDRLENKQLIETISQVPKTVKAIPPEIALKNLIEEKENKMSELKKSVEVLTETLRPIDTEEKIEGVWTIKGKKWSEYINKAAEIYDRCQKYAFCISRDFAWSSRMAEAVIDCQKRKVPIRTICIGDIDEVNYYRARWFSEHGVEIKLYKTNLHPRIIVGDGKEVLIRLDESPVKRDNFSFTSIWSKDKSLAKVIDSYTKNLWKIAKPINFSKIKIKPKNSQSDMPLQ